MSDGVFSQSYYNLTVISVVAVILGILAIILKNQKSVMGIIGTTLGGIALILSIAIFVGVGLAVEVQKDILSGLGTDTKVETVQDDIATTEDEVVADIDIEEEMTVDEETSEKASTGSYSSAKSYQDILDEYTKLINDRVPSLLEEYKEEVAKNDGGLEGKAEILNNKVEELAEIANEGVEEMAEYMMYHGSGDYDEYNDWAGKLYDVYMEAANVIWDEYLE